MQILVKISYKVLKLVLISWFIRELEIMRLGLGMGLGFILWIFDEIGIENSINSYHYLQISLSLTDTQVMA